MELESRMKQGKLKLNVRVGELPRAAAGAGLHRCYINSRWVEQPEVERRRVKWRSGCQQLALSLRRDLAVQGGGHAHVQNVYSEKKKFSI